MNIKHSSAFSKCYIMQHEDIERFADTLADGFSRYNLFEHICNDKYDHDKMKLFWAVSVALIADNAICIADSKEVNSVLIYIRPKSKEPSLFCYLKAGNVDLYKHFQFELKEEANIKSGNLTLFAMHRKSK